VDDLLAGYRVIEVATWLAAPSAGAMLADLGADVIKVEPPQGDTWRGAVAPAAPDDPPVNLWEQDNRGKRSITVDLRHPGGSDLVRELAANADIFITNLLPSARDQSGLNWDDLRELNPRLIYLSFSGYGTRGPDRDRLGFDHTAFWTRSGANSMLGEDEAPPIFQRPGSGDHVTSLACAAGLFAALLHREKTGEGQLVEVSLLGTALWMFTADVIRALITGKQPRRESRRNNLNPIRNTYEAGDGRWLMLAMPRYDHYWPAVARAIERPELAADPRYATLGEAQQRLPELIALLEEAFRQRPRSEWGPRLDEQGLVWAPVAEMPEVLVDPQVEEMGYLEGFDDVERGRVETIAVPFRLGAVETRPRGPGPEIGQHTEEVLLEMGYDWEQIGEMRESGALGRPDQMWTE
jgi:crotonobetainyl-CoA:carnitine CoA-transferase CaiB-like acyl-CoA transferase